MYYIIYPIFYLLSLLPFFILYRLSDFFYVLMYYVFGYRKEIVMGNIIIAFPEKSKDERKIIAKQFYKNFIDTLIETIKMISMRTSTFEKRCTIDMASSIEFAGEKAFGGASVVNFDVMPYVGSLNSEIHFSYR